MIMGNVAKYVLFIFVILFSIVLISASPKVILGFIEGTSSTNSTNSSTYWNNMNAINTTQMENSGGVLNMLEGWITSGWCRLTGCTITGELNVTENLDVGGNFTGNQIYGGMYYHNHTGTTLAFATQDTWYPLYFINATDLNGFSYVGGFLESSNLTAQVSGKYQVSYMGIGSGQNNHVYLTTVLIDGVEKPECGHHHKMSAGGDVITQGGVCIITINEGQTVAIATQDMGGTGTGNYYGGNLNLVRIGD